MIFLTASLHVDNDSGRVEDEEGDDDVEENQEQVQLLLQLLLRTKPLDLKTSLLMTLVFLKIFDNTLMFLRSWMM